MILSTGGYLLLGGASSQGVLPLGGCLLLGGASSRRSCFLPGGVPGGDPPRTATGMHSCFTGVCLSMGECAWQAGCVAREDMHGRGHAWQGEGAHPPADTTATAYGQ